MGKRKIIVDGEVRLVSAIEWRAHNEGAKPAKPKTKKADVVVDHDDDGVKDNDQENNLVEE